MQQVHEGDRDCIEEIMKRTFCPDGFTCLERGLNDLCRTKDIGLAKYVVCEEGNSPNCKFRLSFGSTYFCRCALRVYIVKQHGK